jgi:hypothetical protein
MAATAMPRLSQLPFCPSSVAARRIYVLKLIEFPVETAKRTNWTAKMHVAKYRGRRYTRSSWTVSQRIQSVTCTAFSYIVLFSARSRDRRAELEIYKQTSWCQ